MYCLLCYYKFPSDAPEELIPDIDPMSMAGLLGISALKITRERERERERERWKEGGERYILYVMFCLSLQVSR